MKYRKIPVVIDAVQWNGENIEEIKKFMNIEFPCYDASQNLLIKTLEGHHIASINDFIIRGVKGEFYPCKPDIFKLTYNKA